MNAPIFYAPGKRLLACIFLLFPLVLGACAIAKAPPPESRAAMVGVAPQKGAAADAYSREVAASDVAQTQAIERLVIKNASLTLVVPDPAKSMDTIATLAEQLGGYVVTANLYKETTSSGLEVPRASVTLRVPADRLEEALRRIRAESSQPPLSESLNSQDVTSEYTDLQSRLRNLEAAEAELTRLMKEAQRTEDVLAVYNQLVQIREQIEVIKGQMLYYERSAALSAISVELIADAAVQPLAIGRWQPQGTLKKAIEALLRSLQFLVDAFIWVLVYLLPVLAVFTLFFILPPVVLIRALIRRRRRSTSPTSESQG